MGQYVTLIRGKGENFMPNSMTLLTFFKVFLKRCSDLKIRIFGFFAQLKLLGHTKLSKFLTSLEAF